MKLHFVNGPEAGKLRDVAQSVRIGRELDNDVSILSGGLSRYHAVIEKKASGWVLRDLNSTNGTKLNGTSIGTEETSIKNGDLCTLGDQVFRVEFDADDEPAAAPIAPPPPPPPAAPPVEPPPVSGVVINLQQPAEPVAPPPTPADLSVNLFGGAPAAPIAPPPEPAPVDDLSAINANRLFGREPVAGAPEEKAGKLGNYIFVGLVTAAVIVIMIVAFILVSGNTAKPPPVPQKKELPMTVVFERQRSDNNNVFRFSFRMENGYAAKAKIIDLNSNIAYESAPVRLLPEEGDDPKLSPWPERRKAYEDLMDAVKHSRFMDLQTMPMTAPDAQNYYRVTVCMENKLNTLDEYSNNPPSAVFDIEKAVGEFTLNVLGIPISKPPEEARADAEAQCKLGEELFLNWRAQPENLRQAILHFKAAQRALALFNPKPAISVSVERLLADAQKRKQEEVGRLRGESQQANAMQDYARALELQQMCLRYLDLEDDALLVKNTRDNIRKLETVLRRK